jgi:WD40 repeat protein
MNLNKRIMAVIAFVCGAAALLLALPHAGGQENERVGDTHGDPLPAGALARLGTVRFRTGGRILCAVYSPNGKMLAAGCGDDPVHLWDAETGKELLQIKDPWVSALAFSPDGALLATGGSLQTVRLWKTSTGQPFGAALKGHQGPIKALAFSPDGSLLATAGQDRTIRLWAVLERKLLATLTDHQDEVSALAFSPDGKTLASGGIDHAIRIWEIPSGRPLRAFDGSCAVAALAFSHDGKLISGGDDHLVRMWDIGAAKTTQTLQGHEQPIVSLILAPDGKTLVTGDQGKTIRLWDLERAQEIRQIPRRPGDADALALAPDGKTLAAGGTNNTLRRWDISGKELAIGGGHQAGIASLALTPDGKRLATGSAAGAMRFWAMDTVKDSAKRLGLGKDDALVACASDGKTLALAEGSSPARLIDVSNPQARASFSGPKDDPVWSLAFSPDGKLLAVGHEHHGVQLWNVATGSVARQLDYPGGVHALAFTPDGKTLAAGGAEQIALWETATGAPLLKIGKGSPVASVAFSPDGQILAAGKYDATIQLWDMRPGANQGKNVRNLEGHQSAVLGLAFSPDGRILTSAGHDRSVRLWEVASGQQIGAWTGQLGPATAVAYLPGGRAVVSGSADTSLLIWDVTGRSASGQLALERIAPEDMEGLWQDLASTEVPKAYRALWTLVAGAQDALPLLEKQKRVFLVDPEHIQKLLRDLNDNRFSVRERAHGELAKYGRWIEGVLDTARKKPASEEVRRRVEKLLSMFQRENSLSLAQERLRARRLMMILEQSATPAARDLLEKLSRQAAEADLRADAQASLARLQKR